MEKDYSKRVIDIKKEIVDEIRKTIPADTVLHFPDTFFVHYVDGEVATTEICKAVCVTESKKVGFLVENNGTEENIIDESGILCYEPESLIDILNHTEKAIRDQKIEKLRNIVKKAGGEISFDGKFKFNGTNAGFDVDDCYLTNIRLSDGEIIINDVWMDEMYENDEDFLPTEELDRMIAYVEEKTKESFALTDEQNAAVDEFAKAVKKIKDSGLTILWDFYAGELDFLNTNGKDIEIVPGNKEQNAITKMVQSYDFVDYLYGSDVDDIVLA